MKPGRLATLITLTAALVLLAATPALANMGGQGLYGETDDKIITEVMFGVIAFFPAVICLFSFIQWRLDKRRHGREDAERRRALNPDWRGGW